MQEKLENVYLYPQTENFTTKLYDSWHKRNDKTVQFLRQFIFCLNKLSGDICSRSMQQYQVYGSWQSIDRTELRFFMPFAQSKRIMDDAIQGVRRFLTTHIVQFDRKVNFSAIYKENTLLFQFSKRLQKITPYFFRALKQAKNYF